MSKLRIITGNDSKPVTGQFVKVAGTDVQVGAQKLERVLGFTLEAPVDGVWTAVVRIAVDPNDLFFPKEGLL